MTQIDDVKSRVDIVELIGSYVNLQRSGSSYKANCPVPSGKDSVVLRFSRPAILALFWCVR